MRPSRVLLAIVTIVVLAVSACSADDDTASTSFDDVGGELAPADGDDMADGDGDGGEAAPVAAGGSTGGSSGATGGSGGGGSVGGDAIAPDAEAIALDTTDTVTAASGRRIAYRGRLDAVVDDVDAAVGAARIAVEAEGGFVFGQEASREWARLTFKVPAANFDAALDAVDGIGEAGSRVVEADDVTARYVDLDSRRETLATSIARLRGFLAEASTVDEISRLESELTRREAEHDSIVGQLRVLDASTTLATLTVTFSLDPELVALDGPVEEPDETGFAAGLASGWDAAFAVLVALATAAGFLAPFLPLLAAAGLLVWWLRRRRPVPETTTTFVPAATSSE